jgi:serine/threonine protein phosphatase PrpC
MSNQSNQSNQIDTNDSRSHLFQPGNKAYTGRTTAQQRYIRKMQTALDLALDGLGERMGMDTASACASLICDALQNDFVNTFSKLQFMMPKNINVDVQVTRDHAELTDAELEALIAERRAIAHNNIESLTHDVSQAVDSQVQDVEYVEIVGSKDA